MCVNYWTSCHIISTSSGWEQIHDFRKSDRNYERDTYQCVYTLKSCTYYPRAMQELRLEVIVQVTKSLENVTDTSCCDNGAVVRRELIRNQIFTFPSWTALTLDARLSIRVLDELGIRSQRRDGKYEVSYRIERFLKNVILLCKR